MHGAVGDREEGLVERSLVAEVGKRAKFSGTVSTNSPVQVRQGVRRRNPVATRIIREGLFVLSALVHSCGFFFLPSVIRRHQCPVSPRNGWKIKVQSANCRRDQKDSGNASRAGKGALRASLSLLIFLAHTLISALGLSKDTILEQKAEKRIAAVSSVLSPFLLRA